MAKKSTLHFKTGEPKATEHRLTREGAIEYLTTRIGFVPANANSQTLDRTLTDMYYLDETIATTGLDKSKQLSTIIVDQISGPEGKFDMYTVEALASINKDMAVELILGSQDGRQADRVAQAVGAVPKTNGSTLTSASVVRMGKYLPIDEEAFGRFIANDVRIPLPESAVFVKNQAFVDEALANGTIKEFHSEVPVRNAKDVREFLETHKSAEITLPEITNDRVISANDLGELEEAGITELTPDNLHKFMVDRANAKLAELKGDNVDLRVTIEDDVELTVEDDVELTYDDVADLIMGLVL